MAFRFNFKNPEHFSDTPCESLPKVDKVEEITVVECKYISLDSIKLKADEKNVKTMQSGNYEIKYMTEELVSIIPSLNNLESDLLPNKYEGGLKVWECSVDLLGFLSSNNCIRPDDSVLELGCGVGLPGIFSYLCEAHVTFQDFNVEVVELVTAPNVFLNTKNENKGDVSKRCKFLCGDWGDIQEKFFPDRCRNKLFDVILTSETIYCRDNQSKLLNLMKYSLKQDGVIYVAAKSHYFGVGGGIKDFEDLLIKDNTFDFSTICKMDTGLERQILKLTFKNPYLTS